MFQTWCLVCLSRPLTFQAKFVADTIFYYYFSEKISLDVAKQTIHMKCHLVSLKKKIKKKKIKKSSAAVMTGTLRIVRRILMQC